MIQIDLAQQILCLSPSMHSSASCVLKGLSWPFRLEMAFLFLCPLLASAHVCHVFIFAPLSPHHSIIASVISGVGINPPLSLHLLPIALIIFMVISDFIFHCCFLTNRRLAICLIAIFHVVCNAQRCRVIQASRAARRRLIAYSANFERSLRPKPTSFSLPHERVSGRP